MSRARWWMCADCRSLNDLPANKCYKCRASKPANPSLLDDQYGVVGEGTQRVGITVDLSRIGELTAPDPKETQAPGGAFEVYGADDDAPLESERLGGEPQVPPPPLREPVKRGLAAAGGFHWSHGLTGIPGGMGQPAAEGATDAPVGPPPATPPTAPPGNAWQGIPPPPPGVQRGVAMPPGLPMPPARPVAPGPMMPPPGAMPPPAMSPPPRPGGAPGPPPGTLRPPVQGGPPMTPPDDNDEPTQS